MGTAAGPRLPPEQADAARDLLCQAQAALQDEQPGAALRALARLHGLLVPVLDALVAGREEQAPLSSAAGLVTLYRDLPDLDVERDPARLLLSSAARAPMPPDEAPLGPARGAEELAAQWAWLEAQLRQEPLPRARWWRRLALCAAGGLGDRARVQVQRGPLVVLERLPAPAAEEPGDGADDGAEGGLHETDLGPLAGGDRLTLQLQAPLPGRMAVLHAAGDEAAADLSVLLPASPSEEAARRALEVVEVVGEVAAVEGAPEQALVVLWAPELLPAGWYRQVALRGRLPPEARLWRYRYRVA